MHLPESVSIFSSFSPGTMREIGLNDFPETLNYWLLHSLFCIFNIYLSTDFFLSSLKYALVSFIMNILNFSISLLSSSSLFTARIFNRASGFFYFSSTPTHINLDCSIHITTILLFLRTLGQKLLSKVFNLNSEKD